MSEEAALPEQRNSRDPAGPEQPYRAGEENLSAPRVNADKDAGPADGQRKSQPGSQNGSAKIQMDADANQNRATGPSTCIDSTQQDDDSDFGRSRRRGGRKPQHLDQRNGDDLAQDDSQEEASDDNDSPLRRKRGGRRNKSARDHPPTQRVKSVREMEFPPRNVHAAVDEQGKHVVQDENEEEEEEDEEAGFTEAEAALLADPYPAEAAGRGQDKPAADYAYDDEQLRKAKSRPRSSRRAQSNRIPPVHSHQDPPQRRASPPASRPKKKSKAPSFQSKRPSQPKRRSEDGRTGIKTFSLSRATDEDGNPKRPVSISVERPEDDIPSPTTSRSKGKLVPTRANESEEEESTEEEEEDEELPNGVEEDEEEDEEEEEPEPQEPVGRGRGSGSRRKKGKGKQQQKKSKPRPVQIRLDLNLELEIVLRAKIKGDVTITFL